VNRIGENDRIAIGGRFGSDRRADGSARSGAVIDDHRLLQRLGEFLRNHPRHDVGSPSRGLRHDEADCLGRIRLDNRTRGGCEKTSVENQREK